MSNIILETPHSPVSIFCFSFLYSTCQNDRAGSVKPVTNKQMDT